mmetsp:Transcript_10550/g.33339  ORF Transcript_10550/g.33339 Transcript_10550/m.33339 type:complete len:209 (-) Transcript_10550:258-884(-)
MSPVVQRLRQGAHGLCGARLRQPPVQHGELLRRRWALRHLHPEAPLRHLRLRRAAALQLLAVARRHAGTAADQGRLPPLQGVGLALRHPEAGLPAGALPEELRRVGQSREGLQRPGRPWLVRGVEHKLGSREESQQAPPHTADAKDAARAHSHALGPGGRRPRAGGLGVALAPLAAGGRGAVAGGGGRWAGRGGAAGVSPPGAPRPGP